VVSNPQNPQQETPEKVKRSIEILISWHQSWKEYQERIFYRTKTNTFKKHDMYYSGYKTAKQQRNWL